MFQKLKANPGGLSARQMLSARDTMVADRPSAGITDRATTRPAIRLPRKLRCLALGSAAESSREMTVFHPCPLGGW